jgi:hypothetical protein
LSNGGTAKLTSQRPNAILVFYKSNVILAKQDSS